MRGGVWDQYDAERERLQARIADQLRLSMATLVGNQEDADLLLVSADGHKLPAHRCVLRARAPGFFRRHIEPTLVACSRQNIAGGKLLEVAIGDVDSAALEFFVRSVYTEDEVRRLGGPSGDDESTAHDRGGDSDSRASHHTFKMDESTDFSEVDENDATPQGDSMRSNETGNFRRRGHLPTMTSFRELAIESPMNLSTYSEPASRKPSMPMDEDGGGRSMGKFVHLNESCDRLADASADYPEKMAKQQHIFPMFFGLGHSDMYQSLPNPLGEGGIRARAMAAKRLSVTSLTSLTSIDLTPSHDGTAPPADNTPSCRLAADLLQMYLDNIDTDIVVKTDNGELHAHRCILSATCPYLKDILQTTKKKSIDMKGFTKTTVHFFLSFLYGGLTTITEEVDVWEVIELSRKINMDSLAQVAALHLKTNKCHFFHRPCATCVSAVFDALPQFSSIECLHTLYQEAMSWQARYFARIWKGRVFLHLDSRWQGACFDSLVQQLDEESVIDVLLGCERLQMTLPRTKAAAASEAVQRLVLDVIDAATNFLVHFFDVVVASDAFSAQGKGLSLNLALLEELFPTLVHNLSVDVAIKSFINLGESCERVQRQLWQQHRKTTSLSIPINDWSPRFLALLRRLHELVDRHLLQYAASTVKSEAWALLSEDDQTRIRETGLFVELRQPRAPPPRLSSFNRTYKRSVSAGVTGMSMGPLHDRARSLERAARFGGFRASQLSETPENVAEEKKETTSPEIAEQPKSVMAKRPSSGNKDRYHLREQKPGTTPAPPTATSPAAEKKQTIPKAKVPKDASPEHEVDQGRLERQNTHTIMAAPAVKPSHLPVAPSPIHKSIDKPKSVVKPMVKAAQPAAAIPTKIGRVTVAGTRAGGRTGMTTKSTVPTSSMRSGLPVAKSSPGTELTKRRIEAQAGGESRKENLGTTTRIPRSPKAARKAALVKRTA